MQPARDQWKSKVGFVFAASGSAIGLGNVVFFGANAYNFGAGAFYLPYLLTLVVVGIPVLILEMGLGGLTRRALPASLGEIGGRWGEVAGWWALLNGSFVTMYYVTMLAWVAGMLIGSFGPLFEPASALPAFGLDSLPNPAGYFFAMLSSSWVVPLVALLWGLNVLIVRRGVATIEPVVKVFVPLMWLFMALLIVRGLTLPHGVEGVYLLFTPDFDLLTNPTVWQGAFGQIFFSLSLGFGIMTAYASFLPKDADHTNNGMLTAFMNSGFEFIAGLAIFSLLFTFAVVPRASTLSMMFFVVPQGIGALPAGVKTFGVLFFVLLLLAGLSSSISLVEAFNVALIDKFGWSRKRTLAVTASVGMVGSLCFALPQVIDHQIAGDGTLGLSLLDIVDHWAFSHGLLIAGLVECLIVGWLLPVSALRERINRNSRLRLPIAFDWLIKAVIPLAIVGVLASSVVGKLETGLYGNHLAFDWGSSLPLGAFLFWLICTSIAALLLGRRAPQATRGTEAEVVGAT